MTSWRTQRPFQAIARQLVPAALLCLAALPSADSTAFAENRDSSIVFRQHPGFDAATRAYDRGDYVAAFKAWLPLAQDGDPAAQRNIAHLYRHGLGVAQDFERAFAWYRRAAELGLSRAQANLAEMYLRGQGAAADALEALRWFQRAAHQGHAISQYRLAQLLLRGGAAFEKDPDAALFWLERAADGGYGPARGALARLRAQPTGKDAKQ